MQGDEKCSICRERPWQLGTIGAGPVPPGRYCAECYHAQGWPCSTSLHSTLRWCTVFPLAEGSTMCEGCTTHERERAAKWTAAMRAFDEAWADVTNAMNRDLGGDLGIAYEGHHTGGGCMSIAATVGADDEDYAQVLVVTASTIEEGADTMSLDERPGEYPWLAFNPYFCDDETPITLPESITEGFVVDKYGSLYVHYEDPRLPLVAASIALHLLEKWNARKKEG